MVGFRSSFALLLVCACQVSASYAEEASLRPVMHRVYDAIALLLPASLDEHALEDPLQQEEIRRQLAALVAASSDLERHVDQRDVSFQHLGASLATDVRLAADLFNAGSYEAAGSQLGGLMQNCIACHQKLPSGRQNPLASRLLDRPEIEGLPGVERARIYVAVRRFDGALREWERVFSDPNTSAWHFDLNGSLREYLAVAIRVQGEFARAGKTLDALASREDSPDYLVVRLRDWSTSLEDLEALAKAEPSLEAARQLIRRANERSLYPETRGRLVHDLIASRHLNRFIASLDSKDVRLSEAYYLLGIVEARSVDSFWIPQAELHLTAAIYADPTGPFARSAYLALEEYLVVGEGGIASAEAGAALERLRGLREMVEIPPADSASEL
jgi:tetratricopeptide (TPR) repeat protein